MMDEDTEAFELSVKRYSLPFLKLDRSIVSLKKIQGSEFKIQG
jgi:hypothetical protein